MPLDEALRKGEPVRLPAAGVPVREGGLLGRLMVGLSQDEKKSSSSPAGVLEPEVSGSGTSVMTTSLGYLAGQRALTWCGGAAYCFLSTATRRVNSSLYLVAALELYLALGSLLFRAAVPPWDWKYFVADSLPPTFMMRSWSHCQTLGVSAAESRHWHGRAYCRGWWSAQRRCARPYYGGWRSSRGTGRCQRAPTTRWGSSRRSRSISVGAGRSQRAALGAGGQGRADLVGGLGLELLENLLRLLLGGRHGEGCAGARAGFRGTWREVVGAGRIGSDWMQVMAIWRWCSARCVSGNTLATESRKVA